MKDGNGFLRVQGDKIVDGQGDIVRLRGVSIGGWMNMENFVTGFPGHESGMRAALTTALGETRARFFFERFLAHFITKDDVAFIESIGCTVIRIPMNYRHFESDDQPLTYYREGFALLDRVIDWARAHHLYVILDLHAVPGWQNRAWHCDNGCHETHFWGQKVFEDRTIALWEEIARRYRDDPTVAGYDVLNEPDADDPTLLNHFYRRVTAALRAIDPAHILFLEGNHYAQQFDELDPPFDDNTVYSSHNYVVPGLEDGEYPGEFGGVAYNRTRLKHEYLANTAFMRRYGVPNWVGEFGALFCDDRLTASRIRVLADMIDVIEEYGHHWTLWTYKDIGPMGLVCVRPDSDWMRRTRPVRAIKTALRTDYWVERQYGKIDQLLDEIVAHVRVVAGDHPLDWARVREKLSGAVCETAFSQLLLPSFAEQFAGMDEDEIERMMQSFSFHQCLVRDELARVIANRARQAVSSG